MFPLRGGGQAEQSHVANVSLRRVERATGETTLSNASASGGVSREAQSLRLGFTMAEILLSLTIIGVVAAITLPSLTGNINERTWNTQRKALYARFSQALALMPNLNGYGTLSDTEDTAAETFVTNGLSKVMKINNICDATHLADCGIPNKITTLTNGTLNDITNNYTTLVAFNNMFNGTYIGKDASGNDHPYSYEQLDTKAAAFETANGESILVYYNPNCQSDLKETSYNYSQPKMCANFIYDLNGTKGPNTFGKDIGFISALYPSDPVIVAPMPLAMNNTKSSQTAAGALCKQQDSESRLPNRDEIAAMFYNRSLLGINLARYWSSSVASSGDSSKAWYLEFSTGNRGVTSRSSNNYYVQCVKR